MPNCNGRRMTVNGDCALMVAISSTTYTTLLACCSAVVVLPHYFGPCIRTAPTPISLRLNILSAIRGLYCFICFVYYDYRSKVSKNPLKMNGFNKLLYQISQICYTKYPKTIIPNILNMVITK